MKKIFDKKNPLSFKLLNLKRMGDGLEVKSRDIYEQNSTVFKEDGLFSLSIFGELASKERMNNFGFINLGVKVFHPLVFSHLSKISSLYRGILSGRVFAIYDEKTKTFIETSKEDGGKSGIKFLLKHYDELKFPDTGSQTRKQVIKFLNKYKKDTVGIDKMLVIPAGMREYTISKSGKILEDEINQLYRKLLTTASISKQLRNENTDDEFDNTIMFRLNNNLLLIYNYIQNNIPEGKHGFIQGKWTKRRISYGSMNVLTSSPIKIKDLRSPNIPSANHTLVGIYQFVKTMVPIVIYNLRSKVLNNIFSLESNNTYLVNKETLKKEVVEISEKSRNTWITDNGLEGMMNKLKNDIFKALPITVEDHYLFLVYEDEDIVVIADDINQLPEDVDRGKVRPVTYIELFYLVMLEEVSKYHNFTARHPITGTGSNYPSKVYLKTTTVSKEVTVKGMFIHSDTVASEYPIKGESYFNSMSIHHSHVKKANADFDGDKMVFNTVWTEEGNDDIGSVLKTKNYYVSITGEMNYSSSDDIAELALDIMMRN